MEACAKCGLPLEEGMACSCEPTVCFHCCACGPGCSCGCQEKE